MFEKCFNKKVRIEKELNRSKISVETLWKIHKKYITKNSYEDLTSEDRVKTFMKKFRSFFVDELELRDYLEDPFQYLKDISKIGGYKIYLYHGYVPKRDIEEIKKAITKYLVKVFNLDSFKGFRLSVCTKNNVGYFSTITLSWDILQDNIRVEKIIPENKKTDKKYNIEKDTDNKKGEEDVTKIIEYRMKKIDHHMRKIKNVQTFIKNIKSSKKDKIIQDTSTKNIPKIKISNLSNNNLSSTNNNLHAPNYKINDNLSRSALLRKYITKN